MLEACGIGDSHCIALARLLRAGCNMRELDLSKNGITDRGIEALSTMVSGVHELAARSRPRVWGLRSADASSCQRRCIVARRLGSSLARSKPII